MAQPGFERNASGTMRQGIGGPGVWQPAPPAFLPGATPWLGQMRPFTMKSASQFLPDGPTPLDSVEWERDYTITRVFGAANGSVRTPAQTEIGLFWTEHAGQQYARAFNCLAENQKLDVAETSRLMAVLWTGYADAAIGCFNGKYHYNFWRPATSIPAGGGNSELTADPTWTALGPTPNHPEYPAVHGCVTGALSDLIGRYFGTSKVHIVVDSLAFQDGIHTHTFELPMTSLVRSFGRASTRAFTICIRSRTVALQATAFPDNSCADTSGDSAKAVTIGVTGKKIATLTDRNRA